MKVIDFGDASCRRPREYLDSYVSQELLVETNLEVQKHLDDCPACSREFREVARIRRSLRDAARGERAPASLEEKLRAGLLRDRRARRRFHWGMAIAASFLLLFTAGWVATVYVSGHQPHELVAQEMYISSLAEVVGAVTFLGFADHLHCGVYWKILQHRLNDAEILETLEMISHRWRGSFARNCRMTTKSAWPIAVRIADAPTFTLLPAARTKRSFR